MSVVGVAAGDAVSVRARSDPFAGAMSVAGVAAGATVSACAHSDLFAGAMFVMSAHARCALLARVPAAVARRVLRLVVVA